MSALGQKQTWAVHQLMSALPPKADMCSALAHVCFGPKARRAFNFRAQVKILTVSDSPINQWL